MGFEAVELSLVLQGDIGMRRLNRRWRGKDKTTDVLSFPQWDAARHGVLRPAVRGPVVLGDVVISLPQAARQAARLGHSLEEECARLLVHGVLHLLGHDHENGGAEAQRMRAAERLLWRRLRDAGAFC